MGRKRLERHAGRHALVDGIRFQLPVNSEQTPALMAAFSINADRAAALLPGNEVHPFRNLSTIVRHSWGLIREQFPVW